MAILFDIDARTYELECNRCGAVGPEARSEPEAVELAHASGWTEIDENGPAPVVKDVCQSCTKEYRSRPGMPMAVMRKGSAEERAATDGIRALTDEKNDPSRGPSDGWETSDMDLRKQSWEPVN